MKERLILAAILVLFLATGTATGCSSQKHSFDSAKWQTDIRSRHGMLIPIREGMSRDEVTALLGEPDLRSSDNEGGLVYWMPNTADLDHGAYFVWFKDGRVSEMRFDDSSYRPDLLEEKDASKTSE